MCLLSVHIYSLKVASLTPTRRLGLDHLALQSKSKRTGGLEQHFFYHLSSRLDLLPRKVNMSIEDLNSKALRE